MKRRETEQRILEAYDQIVDELAGDGRGERLCGYERAIRHRSKFESCGRVLKTSYGHEVSHWCRRPVCPTCAGFWGRKLARTLLAACPGADRDAYRMATLILGLVAQPDDAFDTLKSTRRALGNAIDYRRRTPGIDRLGWREFAMAGALELDAFEAEDFSDLGAEKRAQYRALGFEPGQAQGSQWVASIHALVHVGTLGDGAVKAVLGGVAPVVHLQGLHEDKALAESAESIVGYAAKVGIETSLAGGERRPWPQDAIRDYVAATMRCSHGRQAFKLLLRPLRSKQERSEKSKSEYLEPMPIVF